MENLISAVIKMSHFLEMFHNVLAVVWLCRHNYNLARVEKHLGMFCMEPRQAVSITRLAPFGSCALICRRKRRG